MYQKLRSPVVDQNKRNGHSRLLSFIKLIFIFSLLVACEEKEHADNWDIVVGEYNGLLYISRPLIPLHEAEAFPNQTVHVTKIGPGTFRLSSTNANIPNFDFRYDALTTTNTGVIYDEYYFTIPEQTLNGIAVHANTLVYGINNSEIDFTVSSGNGDTLWLFGGEKN